MHRDANARLRHKPRGQQIERRATAATGGIAGPVEIGGGQHACHMRAQRGGETGDFLRFFATQTQNHQQGPDRFASRASVKDNAHRFFGLGECQRAGAALALCHDPDEGREGHSAAKGSARPSTSRASSGLHEPQFVPARVASPKDCTESAP